MTDKNMPTSIATRTRTHDEDRPVRRATETKSALRTTEFFVYVLVVITIVVTAVVVGNGEG
ncbi:hypothetical protein GCM10025867_08980 [Frondihabitans sucicola]|uniref:Uncharacterized protein n=1 Tax=Frondihabitans sucicola TaxID=1268041 RepID=A0ABN6XUG8_9MICO|nr:hypothetical protein [Frondihabitans sucicola]BDZ48657.1 hypothetical protein GCM10025867_08980 [Frondihabitans sucicola]